MFARSRQLQGIFGFLKRLFHVQILDWNWSVDKNDGVYILRVNLQQLSLSHASLEAFAALPLIWGDRFPGGRSSWLGGSKIQCDSDLRSCRGPRPPARGCRTILKRKRSMMYDSIRGNNRRVLGYSMSHERASYLMTWLKSAIHDDKAKAINRYLWGRSRADSWRGRPCWIRTWRS